MVTSEQQAERDARHASVEAHDRRKEPRVLAAYDGNSRANRDLRAALAAAPDETKTAHLGLLFIGLNEADERYAAALAGGFLFGAQVEDTVRLLLRREIREVQTQLGLTLIP